MAFSQEIDAVMHGSKAKPQFDEASFKKELEKLREEIDHCNKEALKLLKRRITASKRVAACKWTAGKPNFDESREKLILEQAASDAQAAGLKPEEGRKLIAAMLKIGRENQDEFRATLEGKPPSLPPSPRLQEFQVGLKLFITRGDELLLLYDNHSPQDAPCYDFPGGRINEGEESKPLAEVLAREAAEELGEAFRYKLGGPVAAFPAFPRHNRAAGCKIFMVGFHAEFVSGEPVLSEEHSGFKWRKVNDLNGSEFDAGFDEGFRQFKKWFESEKNKV
ncbi:MAG: chorismate mutase [Candidatus Micrarchaeota archaeon]